MRSNHEICLSFLFFLFKFSFLLFSLSGVCILAYNTIGSTVDADGFLQEPFFLIPIGWLLFLGGLGVGDYCNVQKLYEAALMPRFQGGLSF